MDADKTGPVYGVPLLDSLPLGGGSMRQALPSRADLEFSRKRNQRIAAGYEVLLSHYYQQRDQVQRMPATADGVPIFLGDKVWIEDPDSWWNGPLECVVDSMTNGLAFPDYRGTVTLTTDDSHEFGNLECWSKRELVPNPYQA